jgi:hypothetical protein
MKKIISMILALILMVTLVSCTPLASTPSSVPLNMADVSTPELDGVAYTAYGIQFEANEDWWVTEIGTHTYIVFYDTETCSFLLVAPKDARYNTLAKAYVEGYAIGFSASLGSNSSIGTATQVVVDNKNVWTIDASATVNGQKMEITIWMYGDNDVIYTWIFLATPDDYEANLPYVQAVIKSMKLPVS